jgi:cation:H+ antiporter
VDNFGILLVGFVLLVVGGELLVRGAVEIAERLRISPLLIGLTFVGLGTSAPELVTSVQASLAGSPGIAVGNIVGSSISNLLFILGLSALITPMVVQSKALRRDGVFVVMTALLFSFVSFASALDRPTGMVFISLLVAYIVFAYRQEIMEPDTTVGHTAAYEKAEAYAELHERPHSKASPVGRSWSVPLLIALCGLGLVGLGGKFLVDGAIGLALFWGMSETVIGLTIVAVGTSMPEFVTSIIAAIRKHGDVAIGNIMGSNIYNILGIGGVTGLIHPTVVPPEIATFDNLVMIGASVAMFAFAWSGQRVSRLEGAGLLAGYIAYVVSLLSR